MSADARHAITDLLARYCAALDRDDVDTVASLFTADSTYHVFGRTLDGPDALRALLVDAPKGLHLGGLPVIELRGDRANVQQNLVFVAAVTQEIRLVLYDDEVVDTPDGWRFRSRRVRFVTPDGMADRPPRA